LQSSGIQRIRLVQGKQPQKGANSLPLQPVAGGTRQNAEAGDCFGDDWQHNVEKIVLLNSAPPAKIFHRTL